jgi:hypothetical protein
MRVLLLVLSGVHAMHYDLPASILSHSETASLDL